MTGLAPPKPAGAAQRAVTWRDTAFWAEVWVVSDWTIRLVMLGVVPMRRTPASAMGWLLFIFLFPWVGLGTYLLIGSPLLPRARREQFARLGQLLQPVMTSLRAHPNVFHPVLEPDYQRAVTLAEKLGHLPILGGNAAELLADYDGVIDRLVTDIDQATDHAHLLFYIFDDDATGQRVIEALSRAAARGVKCRVLIDTVGTGARTLRRLLPRMQAAGIQASETLPLGIFRRKAARFDLRNHRKIVVIDGRIGYAGSQNIVDALGDDGLWNDEMVIRVTGPAVLALQVCFVADWYIETDEMLATPREFPDPVCPGTIPIQVLPSGPGFPVGNFQRLLVALVHGARHHIALTTPYLIPDDPLLQALHTAALRGVRVDIIVSRHGDSAVVRLAQESYYDELLEYGVRIHRYRERFLHGKHVTIDDNIAVVGSGNMDIRSFRLNAEVTVVCYDSAVAGQLRAEADRSISRSALLEPERWSARPLWRKVIQNAARLLSPML